MFYVISRQYVGPNPSSDDFVDASTVEIWTVPATTNKSGEVRLFGWCGTTGDWSTNAHGGFATVALAEAAISEEFGEVRSTDENGVPFAVKDETMLAVFKKGKYKPLSDMETGDWLSGELHQDAIPFILTKDAQESLAMAMEACAQSEGLTLHSATVDAAIEQLHREIVETQAEEAASVLSDNVEKLMDHIKQLIPQKGNTTVDCQHLLILQSLEGAQRALNSLTTEDLMPDPDFNSGSNELLTNNARRRNLLRSLRVADHTQ